MRETELPVLMISDTPNNGTYIRECANFALCQSMVVYRVPLDTVHILLCDRIVSILVSRAFERSRNVRTMCLFLLMLQEATR